MKYLYIRYIPASFPGNPSRRNVYVSIFDLDVWSNFDESQPYSQSIILQGSDYDALFIQVQVIVSTHGNNNYNMAISP